MDYGQSLIPDTYKKAFRFSECLFYLYTNTVLSFLQRLEYKLNICVFVALTLFLVKKKRPDFSGRFNFFIPERIEILV